MADLPHVDRLLPMIRELAERALDMAVDASPHRPRGGERVLSLMHAVPAARLLLGQAQAIGVEAVQPLQEADKRPAPKVVDGRGHARLAYHFLWFDLVQRALLAGPDDVDASFPGIDPPQSDGQPHHDVLRRMCENRLMSALIDFSDSDGSPAPFHPQSPEDAPDAWVYREMLALHGLVGLLTVFDTASLGNQCLAIARYHLQHTQPDYTTYQPWALAAFAWFPETVSFAEQQLHDVATHLAIEGPAGALAPGLLLADAWATLGDLRISR